MKQLRVFIDTETTGLDSRNHAIIELAGIFELNGKIVEEFSWNMRPAKGKLVDKEALHITDSSLDIINLYDSPRIVYERFLKLLDSYINKYDSSDKAYFFAYNSSFDQAFIEQWFKDNNNVYMFSYSAWPWIDVAVLAAIFAEDQRNKLPNFKLGTVAKALGIEVDDNKLHNGLYDVQVMKRIYEILEKEFNV